MTDSLRFPNSQQTTYICFNPHCKNPTDRFSNSFTKHPNHDICFKWIMATIAPNEYVLKTLEKVDSSMVQIPFNSKPMDCMLNILAIKSIALHRIRQYMDSLTHKISQTLKTIWNVVSLKIDAYFKPFEQIQHQLLDILTKCSTSEKVNSFVSSPLLKQVLQSQNMVLLPDMKQAEEKIKLSMEEIIEKLFCTKENISPDIGIKPQEKKNLKMYLSDNAEDHPKKLLKISALFKGDQKIIYEKRNKNHHYHGYTEYVTKCPICTYNSITDKKKDLKLIWNELCEHLYKSHLQQIGYNYEHLISGKAIYYTTLEEIIYKMINYDYEGLELVCKSGKKCYNFHYSNRKKFSIEIIVKEDTSILPIKCLYLSDFQQFYGILAAIAYTLKNSPKSRNKPIYIYSNIPSQVNIIRKLKDLLNVKNIKIIAEKKLPEISSPLVHKEQAQTMSKCSLNFSNDQEQCEEQHKIENQ